MPSTFKRLEKRQQEWGMAGRVCIVRGLISVVCRALFTFFAYRAISYFERRPARQFKAAHMIGKLYRLCK
jgi:hypothetical protein